MPESIDLKSPMDFVQFRLQEKDRNVNPNSLQFSFLKEILKHVSEAVLFIDLSGFCLLANESAFRLLSLPGDSTLGRPFWDLFADDYFGFSMRESLKFGISHLTLYKSHRLLELEITSSFISAPNCGIVVVARDISERQKMQSVLHRNDRMKDLGEMSAQVAHEIRNPLGGIRGFASLLIRDLEGEPHLQQMAAAIIEGTKALEKLVAGILHFARPIQIQSDSREIGNFLKEVVKFVKVDPAFPSSVKVELHIPSGPFLVPFDPEAMKSALLNLIFNAIEAMNGRGVLSISGLKLEGCCHISVTDTGIGMDEEMQKLLFSPFFTTKKKGNGLGLVETKKIVQAHKGSIDVRSIPGKGSTFTIALPLRR